MRYGGDTGGCVGWPLEGIGAGMRVRAWWRAVAVLAAVVAVGHSGWQSGAGAAEREAGDAAFASGPVITRIAGADRFEMSALIAQRLAPDGAEAAYLANGTGFADALSAGPAAAQSVAPVLLTTRDAVPPSVAAELIRLAPKRVVVVGGPDSVSEAVLAQIRVWLPHARVDRIGGPDRYAVSRAIVTDGFGTATTTAFVATGATFPDALSAGAVAAAHHSPVLLVNGAAASADSDSIASLARLSITEFGVAGGPLSVSDGVMATLAPPAVYRLRFGGADRYAVSLAINNALAVNWSTVYLATGANFPDALAGGVLAGVWKTPLFVVPGSCVPQGVLDAIHSHGTAEVRLLGGTASLSPAVATLTSCGW